MKYRGLFPGLFLVSAILLLALGCAGGVIALTEIAANPQPYIGKTVTTEGYINRIGTQKLGEALTYTYLAHQSLKDNRKGQRQRVIHRPEEQIRQKTITQPTAS